MYKYHHYDSVRRELAEKYEIRRTIILRGRQWYEDWQRRRHKVLPRRRLWEKSYELVGKGDRECGK